MGHRRAATVAAVLLAWGTTWSLNRSLVRMRGRSMQPTFAPGQLLVTVPVRAGGRWAARRLCPGRVVVVEDPLTPGHLVVKRLVARHGHGTTERVEVLGDNPAASTDSRHWGPLPVTAVRRVVLARWPTLPGGGPDGHPGRRARSSSSGSSRPSSPSARRP